MLLKKLLGEIPTLYCKGGGGKGGSSAAPAAVVQPLVAPTAPVQSAEIEAEDDDDTKGKKIKSSKKSLKLPLASTETTGLKA